MTGTPFPIVAVVDDDLDDGLLLKSAFEECRPDLRIQLFGSAEDLLDRFAPSGDRELRDKTPHLIVSAFQLLREEGLELVKEAKGRPDWKRIPLILLLQPSSDEEIKRYYDIGANTVIIRPESRSELVKTLSTLCQYWFGSMKM